jgi:hypothetical protein
MTRQLNRNIASFMATESYETKSAIIYKIDNVWHPDFRLRYHLDWNKLMGVYYKIREKMVGLTEDKDAMRLYANIQSQLLHGDQEGVHERVAEWCKNLYHENQNCTTGEPGVDGIV